MFRRARKEGRGGPRRDEVEELVDVLGEERSGPDEFDRAAEAARGGPYDEADAPDDDLERVDLGALQVPLLTGVDVRVEADQQGVVSAVLLVTTGQTSAVQLGVFAAPRSEGIWDEVRTEIGGGIEAEGGRIEERVGAFGPELVARVKTPEGAQQLRFVGVDGPRWFLRAVYTGAAAANPDDDSVLADSVRQLVVTRGNDPMPVRDPLPLRLPTEADEQVAATPDGGKAGLPPPRRGPEITEVR